MSVAQTNLCKSAVTRWILNFVGLVSTSRVDGECELISLYSNSLPALFLSRSRETCTATLSLDPQNSPIKGSILLVWCWALNSEPRSLSLLVVCKCASIPTPRVTDWYDNSPALVRQKSSAVFGAHLRRGIIWRQCMCVQVRASAFAHAPG